MVGSVASLRVLGSHFQGLGYHSLLSQGPRVPGLESHDPGSQDPGSQGPGFQVLILDYAQVRPLPLPDFSCILKKKE